jgi:hypothetical protein
LIGWPWSSPWKIIVKKAMKTVEIVIKNMRFSINSRHWINSRENHPLRECVPLSNSWRCISICSWNILVLFDLIIESCWIAFTLEWNVERQKMAKPPEESQLIQ